MSKAKPNPRKELPAKPTKAITKDKGKKLPKKYLETYHTSLKRLVNPDRRDLNREYAGRGDTHALEGGRINPLNTKRYKQRKKIQRQANLKTWEDRNRANIGSKLNG